MKNLEIPVYLFTGFLESGKTKFIQETLEDKRFSTGEKTLLLVCEEGFEEYEPDNFYDKDIQIRYVDSADEFSESFFDNLIRETKAERVIVEYNGMWTLDKLYAAMPENWLVYQEFMFADATTFLKYNANMRQLVYDKLKSCELVVFNRFDEKTMDKMEFHKIVRAVSRRTDIAYEDSKGNVNYDDIKDPLPFDINAPIVEIGDEDYALWYRDLSEEGEKYQGKTVRVKVRALNRDKIPSGCFIVGRHVMTCCVEDIQFAALACNYDKASKIKDNEWMILTAKLSFGFHKAYHKRGPILTYIESEPCDAPQEEVATMY